jgi:CBS-domain-containing membrane protein
LLILKWSESTLFLASIGGTSVFLFLLTAAPAAQPRAVVAGHLGCATVGLACVQWLGTGLDSLTIAMLGGMAFMAVTRTVHPPAGANPLLVVHSAAGWSSLLVPVAACVVWVLLVAVVWSRVRPGTRYPTAWLAASPPPPDGGGSLPPSSRLGSPHRCAQRPSDVPETRRLRR